MLYSSHYDILIFPLRTHVSDFYQLNLAIFGCYGYRQLADLVS